MVRAWPGGLSMATEVHGTTGSNPGDDELVITPHGVTLRIVSQLIGKLDAVSRQSATYIVSFFGGFLIVSAVLIRAGMFGEKAALRIGSTGFLECLTVGSLLIVSGIVLSYSVFQANARYAMAKLSNSFQVQQRVMEDAQRGASDADQIQAAATNAIAGGGASGPALTTVNGAQNPDQATIKQGLG
jgi:hypothetical protein